MKIQSKTGGRCNLEDLHVVGCLLTSFKPGDKVGPMKLRASKDDRDCDSRRIVHNCRENASRRRRFIRQLLGCLLLVNVEVFDSERIPEHFEGLADLRSIRRVGWNNGGSCCVVACF